MKIEHISIERELRNKYELSTIYERLFKIDFDYIAIDNQEKSNATVYVLAKDIESVLINASRAIVFYHEHVYRLDRLTIGELALTVGKVDSVE